MMPSSLARLPTPSPLSPSWFEMLVVRVVVEEGFAVVEEGFVLDIVNPHDVDWFVSSSFALTSTLTTSASDGKIHMHHIKNAYVRWSRLVPSLSVIMRIAFENENKHENRP